MASFGALNWLKDALTPGSVSNAELANMAQATIKGRASGAGTGSPQDLTAAQAIAVIATADGTGSGLDADLLDGQHAAAFQAAGNYITALTGDVTATGPGSAASTIANDAVTTAKILNSNVTLAQLGVNGGGVNLQFFQRLLDAGKLFDLLVLGFLGHQNGLDGLLGTSLFNAGNLDLGGAVACRHGRR